LPSASILYGGALGSHDESQITADVMSFFIKRPKAFYLLRAIQNVIDAALIFVCGVFATKADAVCAWRGDPHGRLKLRPGLFYTVILVGLF
jgi:hypothetical protein